MTGFEFGGNAMGANPDGPALGAIFTSDAVTFRSGAKSLKANSGAGNTAGTMTVCSLAPQSVVGASIFTKVDILCASAPTAQSGVFICQADNICSIRINTDGTAGFYFNNILQGSASVASICDSTWHRLEFNLVYGSLSAVTAASARLDGADLGSAFSGSVTVSNPSVILGWVSAPGANKVVNFDDVGANTSDGAANNSWLGNTKVILMKPSSDSQRGLWTGGVGGTTNLWDAVDNLPPTGTAAETDATQIENAVDNTGAAATNEYRGDCGSYAAAGVGFADTVNAVYTFGVHGEDVATGTKSGSLGGQANPAQTAAVFFFGNDAGLLGTYPSGWAVAVVMTDVPTVTLGSSFIIGLRKTDSGTRVASACFLGAYVDYTPTPPVPVLMPPTARFIEIRPHV